MKWTREEYPEGYCWKVDIPPLGDFCIDRAEWVDAERPWLACWYVGAYETEIGRARTDTAAMAMVEAWMALLATKIGNALAAGEPRTFEDDGA